MSALSISVQPTESLLLELWVHSCVGLFTLLPGQAFLWSDPVIAWAACRVWWDRNCFGEMAALSKQAGWIWCAPRGIQSRACDISWLDAAC